MGETPLTKKLGIKEGSRVALVGAPTGFADVLGSLPRGAELHSVDDGPADVVLAFATSRRELERALPTLTRSLADTGGLWVAWPKKAAGVPTDLSNQVVQEAGLATGLVDNKVCAIDAVWSALRFVVRVENRAAWRGD
ncbi:MAG TPA: DUF3052 family protein [Gaiellaceae bacterium]|nr:DUF3052 family protein [Gaiellaceae bacterium]